MYKDANKNITSITYNHLNLPTKIVFYNDNFSKIEYLYDASGKKLKKVVYVSGTIITTDYLDGYQYENAVLKFFPTAEGYVNATQNNSSYLFNYVYNYTDHLGNIRLSYGKDPVTGTTKIIKENNYYPFGLSHNNYNMSQKTYVKTNGNNALVPCQTCPRGYQYRYNSKEYQDELGLNEYDYGARGYMPDIVRWRHVDPLAEQTPNWSPYAFCNNNPLYYTDPTGMSAEPPSTHTDEQGNVIAVYNDGDNGVYKHGKNADGGTPTKYQIDKRHEKSTSAGGEKMGETAYWDEFIVPNTDRAEGKIHYTKDDWADWKPLIDWGNDHANNQDLTITMQESKSNGILDIKTNALGWAEDGPMTGRLLNGKFATARSAGNYLAGMNGVTGTIQGQRISGTTYMKLAGAYQVGKLSKFNIFRILTYGASFGPAPYYGEENYSGRRIQEGINAGNKKL